MISIIGNGLVGLLTAHICEQQSWPYILHGQTTRPLANKLLLLTPHNLLFLKNLGLSPKVHREYHSLKVLFKRSFFHTAIHAKNYETDVLCYGVWSNDLLSEAKKRIPVELSPIVKANVEDKVYITTKEQMHVSDWLIGCDGQPSFSQTVGGMSKQQRAPYHCLIIPAHIEGNHLIQYHGDRFTLAALPDTNGVVILSSQYNLTHIDASQHTLQSILGHSCELISIKHPIPITLTPTLATPCFKNQVLLLGNAALNIEPIAAQGLNQALHNLQTLCSINSITELPTIINTLQERNQKAFSQMELIASTNLPKRFLTRLGLYSQIFCPLFQDALYNFGNGYD